MGQCCSLSAPVAAQISTVMAALVAAIHFPEADRCLHGFWKMDGRDKPGHDDVG
jgi:hypothetical protein